MAQMVREYEQSRTLNSTDGDTTIRVESSLCGEVQVVVGDGEPFYMNAVDLLNLVYTEATLAESAMGYALRLDDDGFKFVQAAGEQS